LGASAELLTEDLNHLNRSEVRDLLDGIRCRVLWLQGLVENLLCAAAISQGRFQLHRQPVNLGDLVAEAHIVVEPLLAQRRQRLRIRSSTSMPEIAADGRRIGQVLVNLILNASKYGPKDAEITLAITRQPQALRICVADRGPGLPPGGTARLFEPFHRAPSAEKTGKEGVGLGLAIVKSIIDAHHGQIGAYGRRGGGACFWFALPIAQTTHIGNEAVSDAGRDRHPSATTEGSELAKEGEQ
jgi:two-component system sensor histidine kinase KdpD